MYSDCDCANFFKSVFGDLADILAIILLCSLTQRNASSGEHLRTDQERSKLQIAST